MYICTHVFRGMLFVRTLISMDPDGWKTKMYKRRKNKSLKISHNNWLVCDLCVVKKRTASYVYVCGGGDGLGIGKNNRCNNKKRNNKITIIYNY